jgi:Cu(I)/Ag(I) efflux system membrane protein CusA/SilA
MQRIAVPMIGGMISSTLLTLVVIPAIYGLIKGWRLPATFSAEVIETEFKLPPLKEAAE